MLYTKQSYEKYVDMCIYFDKNFWTEERNDDICYRYLYLIIYMLACKQKCFKHYDDYDDFAQFSATNLYLSFIRKYKQGIKIKSILNYLKSIIIPLKYRFISSNYMDIIDPSIKDLHPDTFTNIYKESVQNQYSNNIQVQQTTMELLQQLPTLIQQEVNKSPYKTDLLTLKNIYMSCLLTFLNACSFTQEQTYNLDSSEIKSSKKDKKQVKIITKNKNIIILWNLDETFKDYINVLFNKISYDMSKLIKTNKSYYTLDDSEIDSIIMNSYSDYNPEFGDNKYKINKEEY